MPSEPGPDERAEIRRALIDRVPEATDQNTWWSREYLPVRAWIMRTTWGVNIVLCEDRSLGIDIKDLPAAGSEHLADHYVGRGWRDRLVDDVVAWFDDHRVRRQERLERRREQAERAREVKRREQEDARRAERRRHSPEGLAAELERIGGALRRFLERAREAYPEAELYVDGGETLYLLSGSSHEGLGEAHPEREITSVRIPTLTGGDW